MVTQAESALAGFDVSRETTERLAVLASELERWQRIKNLVGPATLNDVWTRHIADSLQLASLAPDATSWLDLGSGAGFPGLVVAIAGIETGLAVHLVESNARKCAFLRQVARLTGANVTVHQERLEAIVPDFVGKVNIVSARALAPLTTLLDWTAPLLKRGTTETMGLFPKGREALVELTEARKFWTVEADLLPSRTDSEAKIIRITSIESL